MQERPSFGDEKLIKKRRHLKVVEPKPQPAKIETSCRFLLLDPVGNLNRSKPCPCEALANGWCEKHQHAQVGMDEGERLGYREVEIATAFVIIGAGQLQWLAYFERARDPGLATVMAHLEKQNAC